VHHSFDASWITLRGKVEHEIGLVAPDQRGESIDIPDVEPNRPPLPRRARLVKADTEDLTHAQRA
jgi:hypothetical protein